MAKRVGMCGATWTPKFAAWRRLAAYLDALAQAVEEKTNSENWMKATKSTPCVDEGFNRVEEDLSYFKRQ